MKRLPLSTMCAGRTGAHRPCFALGEIITKPSHFLHAQRPSRGRELGVAKFRVGIKCIHSGKSFTFNQQDLPEFSNFSGIPKLFDRYILRRQPVFVRPNDGLWGLNFSFSVVMTKSPR